VLFAVEGSSDQGLGAVGVARQELLVCISQFQPRRDSLEDLENLLLRVPGVLLGEDVRLSLAVMPGHDGFLLACRLEPAVVDEVGIASVYGLQVGVEIALADLAAVVLRLRVDAAGIIPHVLVDVYFLEQVVLEVLYLVFLV
jgi:hypothetical protein